ncbi:MAG: PucR family transcriptional regulator, partial [Bacillota bacterium]
VIFLTGFLGAKNDVARQCRLVEQIARKGCPALAVFFAGEDSGKVDARVVAAADKAGLTLIRMAPEVKYDEAIADIMDGALYGENFNNSLINNTVFHLLNFEKHSSFPDAVREAAINNDFQLIILSEDFNPVLTVETRHRVTLADAIRIGRERSIPGDAGKVYTQIDVNGVLTYWGPVNIGSEKYFMLIVDNEDVYTAGEITKLAEIIELAMGMWKYTPERDAKSDFIKALIRGNKSLAYNLQDEARITGQDIISVFFSKGLSKDEESHAFAEFEMATDLDVMHINEGDETYGMILRTEHTNADADLLADCNELFNKLKGSRAVRIFHVTGVSGIEGAGDAYKLINESWTFAQSVFPYKRVFTKYELTLVNNCINIQIQGGFVHKNYSELLEPFRQMGGTKGRQLLETLETFVLDAGMSTGKTAQIMDVHTNTVQYRLKKINELLGVEVTGSRTTPGLTLALALKRLERAVS